MLNGLIYGYGPVCIDVYMGHGQIILLDLSYYPLHVVMYYFQLLWSFLIVYGCTYLSCFSLLRHSSYGYIGFYRPRNHPWTCQSLCHVFPSGLHSHDIPLFHPSYMEYVFIFIFVPCLWRIRTKYLNFLHLGTITSFGLTCSCSSYKAKLVVYSLSYFCLS